MSTKPTVCIVESLGLLEQQTKREGEIISRTLQLSGKRSAYAHIRTVDEFKTIANDFGGSTHRYLHLSCHASVCGKDKSGRDRMVGVALTIGTIENNNLVDILAPHMDNRRLFLSSCLAAGSEFPAKLLERSKFRSVLAPVNEIAFDDAAVFWIAFYHLMFKSHRQSMSNCVIQKTTGICAALVNEPFRLFLRSRSGSIEQHTIDPTNQ